MNNHAYIFFNMNNNKILHKTPIGRKYYWKIFKGDRNGNIFWFTIMQLDVIMEKKCEPFSIYNICLKENVDNVLIVPYDTLNDKIDFTKAFKL